MPIDQLVYYVKFPNYRTRVLEEVARRVDTYGVDKGDVSEDDLISTYRALVAVSAMLPSSINPEEIAIGQERVTVPFIVRLSKGIIAVYKEKMREKFHGHQV